MKKFLSLLFAILIVCSTLSMTAFASDTAQLNQQYVRFVQIEETDEGLTVSAPMSYWSYTRSITNGLIINGSSGTICTIVNTYNDYSSASIKVTSTLQYKNSSGRWVGVGSYAGSGTGYCEYERTVSLSANTEYRVVTTGTVTYNGKSDSISATSKSYYT